MLNLFNRIGIWLAKSIHISKLKLIIIIPTLAYTCVSFAVKWSMKDLKNNEFTWKQDEQEQGTVAIILSFVIIVILIDAIIYYTDKKMEEKKFDKVSLLILNNNLDKEVKDKIIEKYL